MTDPTRITALAVTTDDLLTAVEATTRDRRITVLRVTPPFAGRMRARLHVADMDTNQTTASNKNTDEDSYVIRPNDEHAVNAEPITIDPERFIEDVPPLPTVDSIEDKLRKSPTPYSQSRHREWYQTALEAWRESVRDRRVDTVTLDLKNQMHPVDVSYLG